MTIIKSAPCSDYHIYTTDFDIEETSRQGMIDLENLQEGFADRLRDYLNGTAQVAKEVLEINGDYNRPITLLIDCSGSMRTRPIITVMAALTRIGDRLAAQNRPFEILGFTTKTWQGGDAHEMWRDNGRPENPGRLCPLLHLTFKSFQDDWSEARLNLSYAFKEGLLKENIDGEALVWAAQRAATSSQESGLRPALVFISDGQPCDIKTEKTNRGSFLLDHLAEVKTEVRKHMDLGVVALTFNGRPAGAHPEAISVDIYNEVTPYDQVINITAQAIVTAIEDTTSP